MKKVIIAFLMIFSPFSFAGDIGFGHVDGLKYFDFTNAKQMTVYLKSTATHRNTACIAGNHVAAHLIFSKHDTDTVSHMISMLISAKLANQKVRLYSQTDSCEIDFVSLQDSYY